MRLRVRCPRFAKSDDFPVFECLSLGTFDEFCILVDQLLFGLVRCDLHCVWTACETPCCSCGGFYQF